MNLTKLKKSKGFTLIELMIVVAIIGILAAVAIPKFADLVTKSKEAGVKGNLGSVRSALSIYYGDTEGVNPSVGNLYAALTTSDKYLPFAQGFGDFTLPKNSNFAGHTGGRVNTSTKITDKTTTGDTADATPIAYNATAGILWIDCSHNDTKGNVWTSY